MLLLKGLFNPKRLLMLSFILHIPYY